jgi:phosphoglycolate phosphatase
MTAKRDTLLIDLDGTLVDSAPDIARAANAQLARLGRPPLPQQAVKGMVGDGFAKLMERALEASGGLPSDEELAALNQAGLTDYFDHVTDETIPYPGVAVALAGLKAAGWTLAVCTNKPVAPSRRILENLALAPLFAAVAGGDS